MKILRSIPGGRKGGYPHVFLDRLSTIESGRTKCQGHIFPCSCTIHSSSSIMSNRKLYYVLQLMSLLIISCTLIVYQVTVSWDPRLSSNDIDIRNDQQNEPVSRLSSTSEADDILRQPDSEVKVNSAIIKNTEAQFGGANPGEKLENVFLSVKSTKRFHSSRLQPILKTWFNLARDQTWIFTDDDDPELQDKTNGHIINTHCPSTHYRQALCCKMGTEFDTFIQTDKSWFCHFDDDNYVNVPGLLDLLGKYNWREYWYLGKPSLKSPIRIRDPDNHTEEVSFWFATGGAGFCLSRALALRMSPLASGGKFTKVCDRIQLPDDVTVGYIAGHLLGQNLTVIPQFHSHFETMKFIDMKNPGTEITFSYVRYAEYENILEITDGFSPEEDPTRFLSLHCLLFPNFSYCPNATVATVPAVQQLQQRRRRRR